MFFILSKVLIILIQPLNWIVGLLIFSLLSKKAKRKKRSLLIATLLLVFFTNHFTFNQFVRWWEPESIRTDQIAEAYDIGILLGGYSNFFVRPNQDRHNFNKAADRFTQTFDLYRQGKIRKILLTGGSGEILGYAVPEAEQMRQLLIRWGVPDSCIIVENESRNTHENAVFTKSILQQKYPGQSCLLITSAFHMPRASRCFDKVGLEYMPFCVDYMSEYTSFRPASILFPNRDCLHRWEVMIKEMVGMAAYWLKGYI
ncbi:MAG: YdcF family protein [Bacteroidota bacterium]